jgi:2-dehydropantoate 2-reductase
LKTTAPDQYARLLPPLVGPDTVVLTLQNGLGNEAALARLFPASQIMGGLCFVCLNRIRPGVVRHLDHGRVILGEYQGWPEPRAHDIASLFRHAGVPCKVTDNLERPHWEKLVWTIPFHRLGVASCAGHDAVLCGRVTPGALRGDCLTTDRLLAEPRWEQRVRELMREVIAAASALGLGLRPGIEDAMINNTRTMGAYKASTLIDFERGQPLEMESVFLEPLRRAQAAGVPMPRLQALCSVLRGLDPAAAQP